MSNFYSLNTDDRLKRDPKINNLYNLDTRTVLKNVNLDPSVINIYIVPVENEMRLDKISLELYGGIDYVEELMVLNNIKNPFSIIEGQEIKYITLENMAYLHGTEPKNDEEYKKLVDSNKSTKADPNRKKNQGLPPSIRPLGMNQLTVDETNKIIKVINSLQ